MYRYGFAVSKIFLLFCVVIGGLLYTATAAQAQTNLLQNGDFEQGGANWSLHNSSGISASSAHSGSYGLHLSNNAGNLYAWQSFAGEPDADYKISMWVRLNQINSEGTWGDVSVSARQGWEWFDYEHIVGYFKAHMGEWVYYEQDFYTYDIPNDFRFFLEIFSDGNFDIDFDDITLTKIEGPLTRIMVNGDSTTAANAGMASLRYYLWKYLEAAGYRNLDFVGDAKAVDGGRFVEPKYLDWDRDHASGSGAAAFANGLLGIGKFKTDIVLIHMGTNDFGVGQTVPQVLASLSRYVDEAQSTNPNITVLLCQLIPTPGIIPQVIELNALLPALAAEKTTATSRVIIVDQFTGFLPEDGAPHPNDSGQIKMATKYFEALQTVLPPPDASPFPSPTPPPPPSGDINQDEAIDGMDAVLLLNHWGLTGTCASFLCDVNADTKINTLDFGWISLGWGT